MPRAGAKSRNRTDVWQSWHSKKYKSSHLTNDARKILGILTSCKSLELDQMITVLGCSEEQLRSMAETLCRSKHPVLVNIRRNGMPIEGSVSLEDTRVRVICRSCEKMLSSVPCCLCSVNPIQDRPRERKRSPLSAPRREPPKVPSVLEQLEAMLRTIDGY